MKKVLSKTFIRLAVSYLNVKLVKYWQEWFYDDASELQQVTEQTIRNLDHWQAESS